MSAPKHYEVWSPDMIHGGGGYEPPDIGACAGVFLARNAREAMILAVKSPAFAEWVAECRGADMPPFKGLKAKRCVCTHGVCWACESDGCDACDREADEAMNDDDPTARAYA